MEDNDDSDYKPEQSEDNEGSSTPTRDFKSILRNEDSFDSNGDTNFTPNGAESDMKKKSSKNFSKGLRNIPPKSKPNVTTGARFRCEYCSFETRTLKNLLSHKQRHNKLVASGLVKCDHCNRIFFSAEQCTKHLNGSVSIKGNKNNTIVCLKCQLQSDSQLQMAVHRAFDHVRSGRPYRCLKRDCGFLTDQKDGLKGHLMDVHKLGESIFHPLTDACPDNRQASLTCPKCFYKTKNKVYWKAHYFNSHSNDSDAPFRCSWLECQAYFLHKTSLKRHLKDTHGLDTREDAAVPPDQEWDPDAPLLSCRDCDHKSRTDFQMLIHRTFCHHPNSQKKFDCPAPQCLYNNVSKGYVRRHLKMVHNLGEEHFRDYGVVRTKEQCKSDLAEDLVEQVDVELENLDEVSVVDCDYEAKSLSTGTDTRKFRCGLCLFTTGQKQSLWLHQVRFHHKRQCDICKEYLWGMYQWFWHNYSVHNRQRGIDIYEWCLRCELCGYEGTTKNSYKHGATHKLPRVVFLTLFWNVASDYVTFHYAQDESSKIGFANNAHAEKTRREVLDWTMSDEKGNVTEMLQQLKMQDAITIEFADDSDGEAETQTNSCHKYQDDDLLIKTSEFLTCKKCYYETQDPALLKIHGMQMHGRGEMGRIKRYRCSENDCPFQSKYLPNLTRHLTNIHKYNRSLWTYESSGSKLKIEKTVKQKKKNLDVREPDRKHVTQVHASTNPEADADWDPATDPDHHQDLKREAQNPQLPTDRGRNRTHYLLETIKKQSRERPKWQLKCSHCPYVTSLKRSALRHSVRHYRLPMVTFHKYEGNQRRSVLKYRHPNRNVQASSRGHNVGSRRVESIARRARSSGDSADLRPSKLRNVKHDNLSNKTKNNRNSVSKEKDDFVDAKTYSDGNVEEAGLASPKNGSDIETEVKHTTIDSDWICALENDILGDDNEEVIQIEITEDTKAVTETKVATLCMNEEFVCALCKTWLQDKKTLHNHILYEHLKNQKAKCKPKNKLLTKRQRTAEEIPGRVSFECGMCNVSLVYLPSLRNHTYVHARDENNFNLKVRYSKYKGNTRVDTIVIKADPSYVPRNSSGDIRVRSPVLNYDPELPVFACAECNFMTNREPQLTRHKKLHWSKEKDAAFYAQKWFTCDMCYFYCLDAARFKEHTDKHKSRADRKIDFI